MVAMGFFLHNDSITRWKMEAGPINVTLMNLSQGLHAKKEEQPHTALGFVYSSVR